MKFTVYGKMGRIDTVDADNYSDAVTKALDGPVIVPNDERVFRVVEGDDPVYFAAKVRCGRDADGHAVVPHVVQPPRDYDQNQNQDQNQQAATDGGSKR